MKTGKSVDACAHPSRTDEYSYDNGFGRDDLVERLAQLS
jgi:hypothetical protein